MTERDRLDRHIEIADAKFDKMSDDLSEIKSKINNGLSERSILMQQAISELKEHQVKFENRFLEHEILERTNVDKTNAALRENTEAIDRLAKVNDAWVNRATKAVWVCALGVGAFATWVVGNFEAFGQVFGPLFK